ncbi:MAG: PhzF family phenazine biosynthesis protein [Oscillospiraceae bacterium]|nr:PhzF family phenazine biosynthesis protein [Oscillospiraceae bacterium]
MEWYEVTGYDSRRDVYHEARSAIVMALDEPLSNEEMLRISKLNAPFETPFFTKAAQADGTYAVRLFCPAGELPFSATALLATADVILSQTGRTGVRLAYGPDKVCSIRMGICDSDRYGAEALTFEPNPYGKDGICEFTWTDFGEGLWTDQFNDDFWSENQDEN